MGEWSNGFDEQLDILNYHEIASHDDSDFSVELAKLTKGIQQ